MSFGSPPSGTGTNPRLWSVFYRRQGQTHLHVTEFGATWPHTRRAACGAKRPLAQWAVSGRTHLYPTPADDPSYVVEPAKASREKGGQLRKLIADLTCPSCKGILQLMVVGSRPGATAVSQDLADMISEVGSFYIGAVELGERDMEEILGKLIFEARVVWHFAAARGGLVAPRIPSKPAPGWEPLLATLREVDSTFRKAPPAAEFVRLMLDNLDNDLERLGREASPALRSGDFRFPSLRHIANPSFDDFLELQRKRAGRARWFVDYQIE